MRRKRTVYHRIKLAADRGTGLRLTPEEVAALYDYDTAIRDRADADADEWEQETAAQRTAAEE